MLFKTQSLLVRLLCQLPGTVVMRVRVQDDCQTFCRVLFPWNKCEMLVKASDTLRNRLFMGISVINRTRGRVKVDLCPELDGKIDGCMWWRYTGTAKRLEEVVGILGENVEDAQYDLAGITLRTR